MKREAFFLMALCSVVPLFAQTNFRTAKDAARYYEDLIGNLSNQVRSLQDDNAKLAGEVTRLRESVQIIAQNNLQATRDMAELKKRFVELSEKNDKQLGKIADRIRETGAALKSTPSEPYQNSNAGTYDEYTVQPGATLSALSRATGVSVAELKRVNNLKSDVLRVGARLRIPRK